MIDYCTQDTYTLTWLTCSDKWESSLQLCHNGRDGISSHQPHDFLLKRLFRRRSKKTSKLRATALCKGIHRWPANSLHKGPVTRKMFPFDDVIKFSWCLMQTNISTWQILNFVNATGICDSSGLGIWGILIVYHGISLSLRVTQNRSTYTDKIL